MLNKIIQNKVEELKNLKKQHPIKEILRKAEETIPSGAFHSAIKRKKEERIKVIAELKKASPSVGIIREDFQLEELAQELETSGADALSVLTEAKFFQGSLDYISRIRKVSSLPILRKDFIIDEYQIWESRAAGADAILLIVAALDKTRLSEFLQLAQQLKLHCLVEVHDQFELHSALEIGAEIIGINNRNLHDFSVNINRTEGLLRNVDHKEDIVWVSESGIKNSNDVQYLSNLGVDAILIGEMLMRSKSPGKTLREILTL